jgi:spermidine synthase
MMGVPSGHNPAPRRAGKNGLEGLQRLIYAPLLFSFASGVAALIYEIVWFQLLELVIGSTAVSLGILLATFMGGMCLGSLILRRLRFYALELGIAICGILVWILMPLAGNAWWAAACLLPPTLLMGATLPALARHVHGDLRGRGDQRDRCDARARASPP